MNRDRDRKAKDDCGTGGHGDGRCKWLGAIARSFPAIALALCGLVGSEAQEAVAQTAAAAGVTYGQPKVSPGEFSAELNRLPWAAWPQSPESKPSRFLGQPFVQPKFMTASPSRPLAPATLGTTLAPMPSPIQNFLGLSYLDTCWLVFECAGWPPSPNGDVGPNHFIEAVNDAVIAIYNKAGGLLTAFITDDSVLGAAAGPACGFAYGSDPVVLYDWLADRFILSWRSYSSAKPGDPLTPSRCIAVSKTSDPVAGGWWLYSIPMETGTPGSPPIGDDNDNARFGLWHDCLYLGVNEFDATGNYDGVAFASFSRADLYSGAPLTYALGWLPPASNAFAMVPSNNLGRGTNAAQPGTPNYFVSQSRTGSSFEVRTFTSGPNCGAGGTLSAPTNVSHASYSIATLGNAVPQPNTTNKLDSIDDRILPKVQYRKVGNTESLWVTHNVDPCADASCTSVNPTAMQWAQIDVTGGRIATTPVQQQIFAPDATLYRWMGSLAVDRHGNMALGYSTSNSIAPNFPSIAYSGRLATDPPNTLAQAEMQLIAGAGAQLSCGGLACSGWGHYSAMSVDPADDCTFWYVNQYYGSQKNGSSGNWQTRIGSFRFPSCMGLSTTTTVASSVNPASAGREVAFTATVSASSATGTVTFIDGGAAIIGCAAVTLSGGQAQCATSALGAGTHPIVARYSGDSIDSASQSAPLIQLVNPVLPSSLVNAGFEFPEIPALGTRYQYNPTASGVGWRFVGTSGIQRNGSALGAKRAPAGKQAAFVQGTGSIAQTVYLNTGTYTLSFKAARRECCAAPFPQPVMVTVDGTPIGSLVSPPKPKFNSFTMSFAVVTSGAHTIMFAGTNPDDNTTFIDVVALRTESGIASGRGNGNGAASLATLPRYTGNGSNATSSILPLSEAIAEPL